MLFSFSLNCIAQTKLKFNYDCSSSVLEETRVSVFLKSSNDKIEILHDTVRKFKNSLNIFSKESDYILAVEFENKSVGKEALNYPFTLVGNETDIEINVSFYKQHLLFEKKERENGVVEIIKYHY